MARMSRNSMFCNNTWGKCDKRTEENNGNELPHICTDILVPGMDHDTHTCDYCGATRRA